MGRKNKRKDERGFFLGGVFHPSFQLHAKAITLSRIWERKENICAFINTTGTEETVT